MKKKLLNILTVFLYSSTLLALFESLILVLSCKIVNNELIINLFSISFTIISLIVSEYTLNNDIA